LFAFVHPEKGILNFLVLQRQFFPAELVVLFVEKGYLTFDIVEKK
jgi:hypothetical protein